MQQNSKRQVFTINQNSKSTKNLRLENPLKAKKKLKKKQHCPSSGFAVQ